MTIRQLKPARSDNGHSQDELPPKPEKLAPHSREAEEAVIGSILINPIIIHDLKGWLLPHMFFLVSIAWIYEAILALAHRRDHIDILTVCAELEARNQVDQVGGVIRADVYLMGISTATPTHVHAMTYAKYVKELWRRRELLNLAAKLAEASSTFTPEGTEGPEAKRLISEAQQLLNDPYDPVTDGARQFLVHVKDIDNMPEVTWLIPGEIPDKGLSIVFGPSGVGKSFFTLDYALQVSQIMPVLYVAAEGEYGFKNRVAAWKQHFHKQPGELYFYLNVAPLLNDSERRAFTNQIVDFVKPKLIVLDTVAHCMLPGDENSARDMGLFLKAAKDIQKNYDCAVLLVHHTNKEGAIERGSGSLRGAADSMIRLTAEDDVIMVECSKSKDAEPFKTRYIKLLPVLIGDEQYAPVIVPAEKVIQTTADPLTNNQALILTTIADVFEFGATFSDLCETVKLHRGSVQRILRRLRDFGYLSQDSRGAPHLITPAGLERIGRLDHTESRRADSDQDSDQDAPLDPHHKPEDSEYRQDSLDLTEYLTQFETESSESSESSRTATEQNQTHPPKSGSSLAVSTESRLDHSSNHICPMCTKPMDHTRKGWQCPDCGAIWGH